jgi:hypothetical protein
MPLSLVLGLHLFGPKEIIVYIVVILALVAIGLYTRRGATSR